VILLGRPDITLDPRGLCWLTTVATNEALRLLRRSRGETPVGSFHGDLRGHDHDVREPGDSDAPGADERALARIEHAERVEAFRQLKPREREALYLKALRYSYNDIARLTDSTYTAVNRGITEGRAVLRGGRRNRGRAKRTQSANKRARRRPGGRNGGAARLQEP
jgi:DNA-directed RNA polymerase specialized sigma24 family protein